MAKKELEINRGYLDFIKKLGGPSESVDRETGARKTFNIFKLGIFKDCFRLLFLPALLSYGIALWVYLSIRVKIGKNKISPFYQKSVHFLDEFARQYPLHLYPVICKSCELVFLNEYFKYSPEDKIIELAVGDGTLSNRVFPAQAGIVGLDLNPYSLFKTNQYGHIKQRVVSDCLNPPVRPGAFDWLLVNNFLHHITDKEKSLSNWSKIASYAVFNENTPFWSSSWTLPYLLSRLGLQGLSARVTRGIELMSLQCLREEGELDKIINKDFVIEKRLSFFDADTFFLSSVFSALMICYGPPTPQLLKKIFLGPLRSLALPLTRKLAEALLYYDSRKTREKDVFINYLVKSRNAVPDKSGEIFLCPECSGLIDNNSCLKCRRQYRVIDNMLFLLGDNFKNIEASYNPSVAREIPAEHL